jgi:hypothetical protein
MSGDALGITIGLFVEPGAYLPVPVADAAADAEAARPGAEVAPIAQGCDREPDNVGNFLHGQQFVVDAWCRAQWPVGCYSWVPLGWLPVVVRLSGGCRSFSIRTVDRSLWSMVKRWHHRLRTPRAVPLGYVLFAQVRDIPKVVRALLAEPSLTEMS